MNKKEISKKHKPGDMVISLDLDDNIQAYGYIEKVVYNAEDYITYVVHLYNNTGDWYDEYGGTLLDIWKGRLDLYMERVGEGDGKR